VSNSFNCNKCGELVIYNNEYFEKKKRRDTGLTPLLNYDDETPHVCKKKIKKGEAKRILGQWERRIIKAFKESPYDFKIKSKNKLFLKSFLENIFYSNELNYLFPKEIKGQHGTAKVTIIRLLIKMGYALTGKTPFIVKAEDIKTQKNTPKKLTKFLK